MRVEVLRSFRVALDGGNRVVVIDAGTVVEDEFVAGVAMRGGHGRLLEDADGALTAPDNKAHPSAPSTKGRRR